MVKCSISPSLTNNEFAVMSTMLVDYLTTIFNSDSWSDKTVTRNSSN
jgi:hypothetical protein